MEKQTREFKLWFTKHVTNFCGIGKMMKRMKLWSDDLCPCCRQIPEHSTNHLYICPHPTIRNKRETLFKDILKWLEDVNTDPNILYLIHCLWFEKKTSFDEDDPHEIVTIWNILQDIGTQGTWIGLLPTKLCELQDRFYANMGIRSSGNKWGTELINKVLRVTLNLWLERNEIVHAHTKEGIKGMELISLHSAVKEELEKGRGGLQPDDYYLLDKDVEKIKDESLESIRGWLCSIEIERGDFEGTQFESLKDRGIREHAQLKLSTREIHKFLD